MMAPWADSYIRWLDAGWLVGAVALGASVWLVPARTTSAVPESCHIWVTAVSLWRCLPLMVPGVIELVHFLARRRHGPAGDDRRHRVLVVLAFARAARLLKSERAAREQVRAQERYARRSPPTPRTP